MDRFDPLSGAFCDSAKGRALLDALAASPPWRRSWRLPYWLYFTFCRRWILSFYVILYCALAVQDLWILLLAGAAAILLEARVVPRAADLQLSDRAFVEFVLTGQRFQAPEDSQQARKVWRRLLILLALGFLAAVPLWWLARLHASGACADQAAVDAVCRFAAPGATVFKVWLGVLMFAPLGFLSPRLPRLVPISRPAWMDERPALLNWWWDDPDPRPFDGRVALFLYLLAPLTHVLFFVFAVAIGSRINPALDLIVLLGGYVLGCLFPLTMMALYAEWKGWMTVGAFLETDYGRNRTHLMRG